MRRSAVLIALGAIALASTIGALQVPSVGPASALRPAPRAAVLSLRRTPQLLSDLIASAKLGASLDKVLQDPDLGNGRTDNCLIVSSPGGVLYDHNPDRQLIPASTIKLLTATVALKKLNPDGFVTEAVTRAGPSGGVVRGDLWLKGGGDPLLGTSDYEASFPDRPPRLFTDLGSIADAIVAKGVRRIDGRVLGDDSRYDSERYLPSWKAGYRASGNMGALSALAVNDGFVSWQPAAFAVAPEPAAQTAAMLTSLLRARGVTVNGEPGYGTAPADVKPLASVPSLKLRQIVGEMLVHSDNETAELLAKALGSSTTSKGVAAIRDALAEMGYDVSGLAASDASGLDTGDRATCSLLHAVLTGSSREALLAAGLSVAGQTGTMFDQFDNNAAAGRLKAKTGALEGVIGLAGIVEPQLTFAFLANGLPPPSHTRGERLQERLGAALAAYPDAPSPESLAP